MVYTFDGIGMTFAQLVEPASSYKIPNDSLTSHGSEDHQRGLYKRNKKALLKSCCAEYRQVESYVSVGVKTCGYSSNRWQRPATWRSW